MTEPTTERLAQALEEAKAPILMIVKAREGFYDDYKSPMTLPINQLVSDLQAAHLHQLAERAIDGEFDGTKEEADEWAQSPGGQRALRELTQR